MTATQPIRVVVAKPGLDGHDRGAKVIARALRDAGMEVIYTGIFQSPESIANTVVQEDADVLGISSLSGAHLEYAEDVMRLLREHGRDDVLFLVGGTVPDEDVERLTEIGIDGVFGPGTPTRDVVGFIKERIRPETVRTWAERGRAVDRAAGHHRVEQAVAEVVLGLVRVFGSCLLARVADELAHLRVHVVGPGDEEDERLQGRRIVAAKLRQPGLRIGLAAAVEHA